MSDCINSEKPASGAAKNFPKERKKPSPVNQGKAGKRPHPVLRATFPSQGKALRGAVQSCAKRKVCPCEEARRADVAPSGDSLRLQSVVPWLPLWGSCHEVTERANRTLSAPFRGVPLPERQDPHGYLPFCVFLGAVYSISREMSSVYLRKKSGPLSSKSSTDTPSSSSAWQAGSSRGRPKSLCIRRIR